MMTYMTYGNEEGESGSQTSYRDRVLAKKRKPEENLQMVLLQQMRMVDNDYRHACSIQKLIYVGYFANKMQCPIVQVN